MHTGRDEHFWRPLDQPARPADQRVRRHQPARLRPDAAQARVRRLRGPRGALRKAPDAVGRADRRLGPAASSSWWRSPPTRRSTTTSWRSGARTIRCSAKGEYLLNYRLHWCCAPRRARSSWQGGRTRDAACRANGKNRQFIIDFVGDELKALEVRHSRRRWSRLPTRARSSMRSRQPNPEIGGWRVSIELDPQDNKLVELHARLLRTTSP